jgi:hypothetical protein
MVVSDNFVDRGTETSVRSRAKAFAHVSDHIACHRVDHELVICHTRRLVLGYKVTDFRELLDCVRCKI